MSRFAPYGWLVFVLLAGGLAAADDVQPLETVPGWGLVVDPVGDCAFNHADGKFSRVFQNLVANAIKYTPRGEVVIGAGETGEGAIECWVSDNGAGIPDDLLEIVFDKLETDPQSEGGTGLGLAIVKTFVEAHGGKATVDSKKGQGSTFRFTLPCRTKVKGD